MNMCGVYPHAVSTSWSLHDCMIGDHVATLIRFAAPEPSPSRSSCTSAAESRVAHAMALYKDKLGDRKGEDHLLFSAKLNLCTAVRTSLSATSYAVSLSGSVDRRPTT